MMSPDIEITHQDYLKLINTVFTTPEGKLLLEVWQKQFLFRKIAMDGDELLSIGLKQGEASFVLSIINLINQHKKEK